MSDLNIPVFLGDRSYAITVTDSFAQLPVWLKLLKLPTSGWVISHQRLLERYGKDLLSPLDRAGWSLKTLTIPESETSKSLATVQRVVSRIARGATMRVPLLIAFGGGVVGDLAGFVAAVFRRGVPYVQVPTTLLAQVDSAIGGKGGVDLPQGKNLVGAFYQPRLVCNNISLLQTLPPRQRRSGLSEVIKYGAIADRELFRLLEERLGECLRLEQRAVRVMVERSCRIKARVVSRDERETTDVRATLNFGHTLGHALEAATRYRRWTHGEAIAIGMCAAARLSVTLGICSRSDCERLIELIQRAGLPTQSRGVSVPLVRRALASDKKFIRGRPRWVLLKRIGQVGVMDNVPMSAIERVIAEHVR